MTARVAALICSLVVISCYGYKPVVLMHGITADGADMDKLEGFIQQSHPATTTFSVNMYDDAWSFVSLWDQAKTLARIIKRTAQDDPDYDDGYHLVCHSQGALLCRIAMQFMDDHKVDRYISLAGPHMGIYGDINGMDEIFPNFTIPFLWRVAYNPEFAVLQDLSAVQYWRDPAHNAQFLNASVFFPVVNNYAGRAPSDRSPIDPSEYKGNLLRVNEVYLMGSSADDTILPWQSSHFGFYDENYAMQDMTQREDYIDDTFGLRSLDESGRLHVVSGDNVTHSGWVQRQDVYDQYIAPLLT